MDRTIIYDGEGLRSDDFLNAGRAGLVALAKLSETLFGSSTLVDGLGCTPGAGLSVSIAAGSIYTQAVTDATPYGTLPADSHVVLKQGLLADAVTLSCPALGTAGQSVNYLVEVQFQENDTDNTSLPFYDTSNPNTPIYTNGNTRRKDVCAVQVKAGTPATTGSQATPAPDAGWIGVWVVTVANGASSINTGNITQVATAPFVALRFRELSMMATAQVDVGAINALVVTSNPPLSSYGTGRRITLLPAATNNGPATLNWSALGAKAIVSPDGAALGGGELVAGRPVELIQLANGNFTFSATPWVPTRSAGDGTNAPASTAYADMAAALAAAAAGAGGLFVWQQQGI